MNIGKTKLLLGAATALLIALAGCGSTINNEPSTSGLTGVTGTDAKGVKYVGQEACIDCHGGFSWSSAIVENYLESKHNDNQAAIQATACRNCHDPVQDGVSSVSCEACHGGGGNHYGLGAIPNPRPTPADCTVCHQLFGPTGDIIVTEHDPAGDSSVTDMYRTIADTHHDDPSTTDVIEGYAFDVNDPKACVRCHDPHSADLTINIQWARSGHGGFLLQAKEAAAVGKTGAALSQAVHDAGADGETVSWAHYDWDSPSRVSCQRCHTATGSANFLSNPYKPKEKSGYDGSMNVFSELEGWDPASKKSTQNGLLYCYGCHTDNEGGLWDPGPIPVQWSVVTGTATSAASPATITNVVDVFFPNAGASNVCVNCHGARGSQADLSANLTPTNAVAPSSISQPKDVNGTNVAWPTPTMVFTGPTVTKTHYLPAAAVLFQATVRPGFEFSTSFKFLSYSDPTDSANGPAFVHKGINQTTSGPCVTCHMAEENHTFEPAIETQADLNASCNTAKCHDGEVVRDSSGNAYAGPAGKPWVNGSNQVVRPANLTTASFAELETGFSEALALLKSLIQTRIVDDTATTTQGAANPANGKTPVYNEQTNPYWLVDINGDRQLTDADKVTYSTWSDVTKSYTSTSNYINFTDWGNVGNMGAAMNYYFLKHEPGAFVHNPKYAKRILFDSINWIQSGSLSGTVSLSGSPAAAKWMYGGDGYTITSMKRP